MTIPVWTSSNGRKTPIDKMADRHLDNTIAVLERAIPNGEAFCRGLASFNPSEVTEHPDRAGLVQAQSWLEVLRNEKKRRESTGAHP